MRASRTVRFTVGVVIALLLCSSSVAQAATVAYWRFEEGPADGYVQRGGLADGVFYPGVADSSGNGNALSAWSLGGDGGGVYRTTRPAGPVLQTGAANDFAVQSSGSGPAMFTETGSGISTMTPAAFTIEVSFMLASGGYRTIIGRDSRGTATLNPDLAALYFQLIPDDALAIKFCDVSGIWHEAISATHIVQTFTAPYGGSGNWYHAAAVSTGTQLLLYLKDVSAGTDWQLIAQADMTLSGSPNTALTAGAGDGGDWDAGNWSVQRGLFAGNHGDRATGFVDEIRISDAALVPNQFLFSLPPEVMVMSPDTMTVATIDAPSTATLVVPEACNLSQALDVTVTSDNPAVAKPVGSQGSTVVHFPAGGLNSAPVQIEFGTAGEAHFTLSSSGCTAGAGPALTVNAYGLQSVSLEFPYDVMSVNQTQQATVTGDYGTAGTRNVSAASFGTTYDAVPTGIVTVSSDGLITAVGSGTVTLTATHGGVTTDQKFIAVMPSGHTVAYWRFEEGPLNANVARGGQPNGVFYPGVADSSGNGNALSAWSLGDFAGYAYRTNVAQASVPEIGASNHFCVQNTGGSPGMFTQTGAAIQTISPSAWTIEISCMPETGGNRTLVGRDSQGVAIDNASLAALYLQILSGDALAIKYADVSGYWHEAISAAGVIHGFPWPDTASGRWYHIAAVCDGSTLSLYLNDVNAETGYQLIAQTDLTQSGSPNTTLTAGAGDGSDWDPGNWSVGRGLFNGTHTDRAYGFIDEVRISDVALQPSQFLFTPEYTVLWPQTMNAAPIDAPQTISVVIPSACNDAEPVDITVTSDNPAVAKPVGSQGSAVVHFPAGNGRLLPLQIEFVGAGEAHFTLSASTGCPVVPGTAMTVTVHSAESVDLQIPRDLMKVGGTQQASVVASYGAAGIRDVAAASMGTTYDVVPSGVVNVSADGLITAAGLGSASITATHAGITTAAKTVEVKTPNPRVKIAGSGVLLVDLSATDATAGQSVWINKGSLSDFNAIGQPILGTVAGEQAVTFNGADGYQGPLAPIELRGGQGRTIEVWVYNPALDGDVETMVSWGHRGGPDGTLMTFSYGQQPEWGAVGGWGPNYDLGWNPSGEGAPAVGEWHHLVYTYDPALNGGTTTVYDNGVQANTEASGALSTHPGYIDLVRQNLTANPLDFYDTEIGVLSLAVVRVHDGALSAADVGFNYRSGITLRGEVPPDLDLDTHVDQNDVVLFANCANGPSLPLTPDCSIVDFDGDGDGDQMDFAILQRCYTGPTIVATPACMD